MSLGCFYLAPETNSELDYKYKSTFRFFFGDMSGPQWWVSSKLRTSGAERIMQNSKLHKERWMIEFSARIIGINRVVSQDRGHRTSMTLEQSESIPANKNKTATRVYLQYHWRCWIFKTVHVVTRKGAIREINNGVGTINPCLKCCSVFCFALQNHEKFLVPWRKTDAPYH